MTLTYELDPYPLKTYQYLQTKNELSTSRLTEVLVIAVCQVTTSFIIQYNTIVAWCTLKYKIKNSPVAYYRVSKSYVVLGNARVSCGQIIVFDKR